jgi:hypothetical protein
MPAKNDVFFTAGGHLFSFLAIRISLGFYKVCGRVGESNLNFSQMRDHKTKRPFILPWQSLAFLTWKILICNLGVKMHMRIQEQLFHTS